MKKTLAIGLACALALGVMPLTACVSSEEEQLLDSLIAESGIETGEVNVEVKATASFMGQSTRSSSKQQIIVDENGTDVYTETYDGSSYLYRLSFAREEGTYSLRVSEERFRADYFSTLLNQLEQGDRVVEFTEGEMSDIVGDIGIDMETFDSKAGTTLARNALLLCDGSVEKTESGYSLAYELDDAVEALCEELLPIAKEIDKNEKLTVSQLLDGKGKSLFNRLLKDITGRELNEMIGAIGMPEPKDKESAADYLRRALKTETDGEIPGNETVRDALSDMGFPIDSNEKFEDAVKEFEEDGANGIGALIMTAMGVTGVQEAEIVMTFTFDGNKKFTGFSASMAGEGNYYGADLSASVKLGAMAKASRPLADVTKFYQNGAPHWTDQSGRDAAYIKMSVYDEANDHVIGTSMTAYVDYEIKGDRLHVVIDDDAAEGFYVKDFYIEYTFDLTKQTEQYESKFGTLIMTQSDENEHGGYETLMIEYRWTKNDEDAVYPEPYETYCWYAFIHFEKEYEKIPVTR